MILWTDESYFSQDGIFNQHNNHIWATENPFAVHPCAHQHRFGINLWAGVIDNNLVGPFTPPARVNAENFLQFLQNDSSFASCNFEANVATNRWRPSTFW
jgi:hypothetical protein